MRIPSNLTSLVDEGLIDEVVRPLMSGKEAEVFLVWSGGQLRVAKVYKEAQNRTFKNRAAYTEGRKVRNSRDQRAMDKRSRHGRAQDEAAWRSTEVDMIYRLQSAGVRVPVPYHSIDGVLVMEMVSDADGNPAPRLAETSLDRDQATWVFHRLLGEVVRMLCAGVVHGDLSDFNVLMGADGPVIIDFPQSVDAAQNQNARKLLLRDVDNLYRFLSRFFPEQRRPAFGEEMWELYANSALTPETRLTGRYRAAERRVDTRAVLDLIGDANYDERKRRERQGISMRGAPTQAQAPAPPPPDTRHDEPRGRPQHVSRPAGNGAPQGQRPQAQAAPEHPRNDASQRHQHADHRPHQQRYDAPPAAADHRPQRPQQARYDAPQRQQADNGPPQRHPQHADQRPQEPRYDTFQRPRNDASQRHQQHADNGPPQRQHADNGPPQRHQQHDNGPRQRHYQQGGNGAPQRHPQAGNGPPQRHPHADNHESHVGARPPQGSQEPQRQPAREPAQRPEEAAPQPTPKRRVVISVSTNERRPGSRRNP